MFGLIMYAKGAGYRCITVSFLHESVCNIPGSICGIRTLN